MSWLDPRIADLRSQGATIADRVYFGPQVYIERDFCALLTIEEGVVLSNGVSVILHDSSLNNILGEPVKFGPVVLRRNCYVGVNATILCGVEIGAGALVGACALVTTDIPAGAVALGQPAKVRGSVNDLAEKHRQTRATNQRFFFVDMLPWRERDDHQPAALAIAQAIGIYQGRKSDNLNHD